MRKLFDQLGYPQNETIVEAYNRVARDGGHVQGNDVVTTYEQIIADAQQNLDAAFDIRPKAEVVVIGGQTGGYYMRGSYDGFRPGAFYAAVDGSGEDYYAMPTLAYHEAIPGHHFQIALAQELEGLPTFRNGVGFSAFAEGWALYAEYLAAELGWYEDDPYGYLGLLQGQSFRAARLVVDTGLHAKGWTYDQAQEFFTENTGFEVGDSVHPGYQIARYLVWPGQSTSYYVGYLKILELRQKAMDQLGDQFDLKEFHNVILSNGSLPLEILVRVVDDYINAQVGEEKPIDAHQPPTTTPTPLPTATETPAPSSTHTSTPEPVEEVDLLTRDGLTLAGWFYHPTGSTKQPIAVILAHQLNSSHFEWRPFAELLAQNGYTALAFDFRGQGRSPGVLDYSSVGVDVHAAIQYLNRHGYDRIVCMGASMGGSGCLAAAMDSSLEGLVNLSGPMNIPRTRLVTDEDLANLVTPKLFMIAKGDTIPDWPTFVSDFEEMYEKSAEPKELILYPGQAHGTGLLRDEFGEEVLTKSLDFLTDLLPAE